LKKNIGEFTVNELIEYCTKRGSVCDEKCEAWLFCRYDKQSRIWEWYPEGINLTVDEED